MAACARPAVVPDPNLLDYSTRCGLDGRSTQFVPNPSQVPYGIGIPTSAASASPIAGAKVQFAASQMGAPYSQAAGAPVAGGQQQVQAIAHTREGKASMGEMLAALSQQRQAQLYTASDADIQALFKMKDRTHTRELFVEWNFSESQASCDRRCLIKTVEEPDVFKFSVRHPTTGVKRYVGDLSTGIMLHIKIMDAFSSARNSVGITITGVPGRMRTLAGKRFPMILSHKQSVSFKKGRVIHQVTDIEGIHRAERLGHITEESLRGHVIAQPSQVVKDASYLLAASPLFAVIKQNASILKIDLESSPHVDGVWYSFEDKIINAARRLLKRDYFDKRPNLNMAQLQFGLERVQGEWGDMSGVDSVDSKRQTLGNFHLRKPNQVRATFQVNWMLAKHDDCDTAATQAV